MSSTDTARDWERASAHWDSQAERIRELTAEATAGLLARLRPQPGQRLLDVAAGTGDPSLRLAEIVGPAGHIMATDGSQGMVDALSRRARERGLPHITPLHAPAEKLSLPAAFFDGACCRFGAMFFDEPVVALGHMHTAVRRGGRLVLAVWGLPERNPYFTLSDAAMDESDVPDVPRPERTPFDFAEPGKLAPLVAAAGWRDVTEERAPLRMRLAGVAPAGLLDTLAELSCRVGNRLTDVQPALRARAAELLARRAQPFVRGPDIEFPAEVVYLTAVA